MASFLALINRYTLQSLIFNLAILTTKNPIYPAATSPLKIIIPRNTPTKLQLAPVLTSDPALCPGNASVLIANICSVAVIARISLVIALKFSTLSAKGFTLTRYMRNARCCQVIA